MTKGKYIVFVDCENQGEYALESEAAEAAERIVGDLRLDCLHDDEWDMDTPTVSVVHVVRHWELAEVGAPEEAKPSPHGYYDIVEETGE